MIIDVYFANIEIDIDIDTHIKKSRDESNGFINPYMPFFWLFFWGLELP